MGAIEKAIFGAAVLGVFVGGFWGFRLIGLLGLGLGVAIGVVVAIGMALPFVAMHGLLRVLAIRRARNGTTDRLGRALHLLADAMAVLMVICASFGTAIVTDWVCHRLFLQI